MEQAVAEQRQHICTDGLERVYKRVQPGEVSAHPVGAIEHDANGWVLWAPALDERFERRLAAQLG